MLKSEDTREAPQFSITLTRATAPWAYARGDPFRTIASLKLLGSLVSLVLLVFVEERRGESSSLIIMKRSTDSQGDSFLYDRLLTTRCPLGVVLMELAHQMKLRRMLLQARWVTRPHNQEADDLKNYELRHFDPKKRAQADLQDLNFRIMNQLFEVGDDYIKQLEAVRESEKRKAQTKTSGGQNRKAPKRYRPLRESDPWKGAGPVG